MIASCRSAKMRNGYKTETNKTWRFNGNWLHIIMTKLPVNTILQMQIYELKTSSKSFEAAVDDLWLKNKDINS